MLREVATEVQSTLTDQLRSMRWLNLAGLRKQFIRTGKHVVGVRGPLPDLRATVNPDAQSLSYGICIY